MAAALGLLFMIMPHLGHGQLQLASPFTEYGSELPATAGSIQKLGELFSQVSSPTGIDICLDGNSCKFGKGCKHVTFIRHAEGEHQVANAAAKERAQTNKDVQKQLAALPEAEAHAYKRQVENWPVHWDNTDASKLLDAQLTPKGRQQCLDARETMPKVDLLVVSPLRRTLETALLLFQPMHGETSEPSVQKVIVHDLCRERYGEFLCDKRNTLSLNKLWRPSSGSVSNEKFDDDVFWNHWDWQTQELAPSASERPQDMPHADDDLVWRPAREPADWLKARSRMLLRWVLNRPEDSIAVVTHSAFMRIMLGMASSPNNAEPLSTVVCTVPVPKHNPGNDSTWGSVWTYLLTAAIGAALVAFWFRRSSPTKESANRRSLQSAVQLSFASH